DDEDVRVACARGGERGEQRVTGQPRVERPARAPGRHRVVARVNEVGADFCRGHPHPTCGERAHEPSGDGRLPDARVRPRDHQPRAELGHGDILALVVSPGVRQDLEVRILSLLPSATEIVYALGLGDQLIGVTHECDWPPEARSVRVVSHSALPPVATPAEVDRLVSASVGDGEPIYRLDVDAIRELRPDIVLSQDLCAVCAVPSGHVNAALDVLGCRAEVVSLDPSSVTEVLECVRQVARAAGVEDRATALIGMLEARLAAVRAAVAGLERPRVFALEWSDPPFNGGHWVPEMIE